ncbi:MAG: peptidase [Nitrosopumilus sp.]|nr:peptidase [Nitrosopumilus sp.]MDA7944176.1 peptidase [Nitrosopumilus sp.]
MEARLPVLAAAAALVLAAASPAYAQFQAGGVDKEGSWFVGEGLKQGDYFRYSMCHLEYKECVDFDMRLWIKGDIESGSETKWLAEAVVRDGNRVFKGEMELGKIAPEPTGGSEDLTIYRGAFKSSVVWLSAFATADTGSPGKGPKEFMAKSWGKIANIGGEQVIPVEIAQVRTGAGTWDSVVIGWKTGGEFSRVWVVDGFPFPVKAKTFAHVSEGIAPVEYEFELLEYEEGVAESPFGDVVATDRALAAAGCDTDIEKEATVKRPTAGFSYQIHAFYGPAEPVDGCPMEWLIKFISKYDETEFLNQVQFDMLVLGDDNKPKRSIADEEGRQFLYSPSGQYELDMVVKEGQGDVTYTLLVYGLAPENWVPQEVPDYLEIVVPVLPGQGGPAPANPPETRPSTQPSTPPAPQPATPPAPEPPAPVPSWIKTSTGLWVDGQVDDSTFVSAMQFLIREGVLAVPATEAGSPASGGIPDWIRTSAGLWVDGQVDDATFVSGMQFLIRNGILPVG